jgi:hypothetical protein
MIALFVILRADPLIFASTCIQIVVAITLVFFLGQQIYFCSKNQTQIELDKIQEAKIAKARRGDKSRYVHAYDRGVLENWKELLWPKTAEKHTPKSYEEEFHRQAARSEQEMRGDRLTRRRGR